MKRYVLLSLLLHAIVLQSLFLHNALQQIDKPSQAQGKQENLNVNIKEKEVTEVSIVEPKDVDKSSPTKQKLIDADKECPDNWFGGIGIQVGLDNTVMKVFKGYGAYAAGLKDGDVIVGQSEPEIRGTPGTHITITVLRMGRSVTIYVTRTKVCY